MPARRSRHRLIDPAIHLVPCAAQRFAVCRARHEPQTFATTKCGEHTFGMGRVRLTIRAAVNEQYRNSDRCCRANGTDVICREVAFPFGDGKRARRSRGTWPAGRAERCSPDRCLRVLGVSAEGAFAVLTGVAIGLRWILHMAGSEDTKYSGQNVDGPGHSSPYPVSRLAAPISLVDTAKEIESASASVALRTNAQLEVILEQMRTLQQRAREIIEQAARDVDLIHVECRFRRVAGRVYHLYERSDGHRYFSMLTPEELGYASADFIGSFRFEYDQSWTRLDEVEARDRRRADIQAFAAGRLLRE